MEWILTFASLAGYVAGLIILVKIMPTLVRRSFDDMLFILVAAVAILGAMLAFGAVGVTFAAFSGTLTVRGLDAFLLFILFIVTLRTSFGAFRPRYGIGIGSYRASRVLAGSFFLVIAVAAFCLLALLFVPT